MTHAEKSLTIWQLIWLQLRDSNHLFPIFLASGSWMECPGWLARAAGQLAQRRANTKQKQNIECYRQRQSTLDSVMLISVCNDMCEGKVVKCMYFISLLAFEVLMAKVRTVMVHVWFRSRVLWNRFTTWVYYHNLLIFFSKHYFHKMLIDRLAFLSSTSVPPLTLSHRSRDRFASAFNCHEPVEIRRLQI